MLFVVVQSVLRALQFQTSRMEGPRAVATGASAVGLDHFRGNFAHEESEIWTSLSYSFTKVGLLKLPG